MENQHEYCNKKINNIAKKLIYEHEHNNKIYEKLISKDVKSINCNFKVIKHNQSNKKVISVTLWKSSADYVRNLSLSLLSWKTLRKKYWDDFNLRIYTDISVFEPFNKNEIKKYENLIHNKLTLRITFLLLLYYINDSFINKYNKLLNSTQIPVNKKSLEEENKKLFENENKNFIKKLNDYKNNKLLNENIFIINADKPKEIKFIDYNKLDKHDQQRLFMKYINNINNTKDTKLLEYIKENHLKEFNDFYYHNNYTNLINDSMMEEYKKNGILEPFISNIQLKHMLMNIKNNFNKTINTINSFLQYMPFVDYIRNNTDFFNSYQLLSNNKNIEYEIDPINIFVSRNIINFNGYETYLQKKIKTIDINWIDIYRQLLYDKHIEIWLYSCYWGQNKNECSHKKTFGSLIRYQPIFDDSVDICIIRNMELLTSDIDRNYYNEWIEYNMTIFNYTFDYTCSMYESVIKYNTNKKLQVCNIPLRQTKMMLASLNINKTTNWFITSKISKKMLQCINDLFKKIEININKYATILSTKLPESFYDFTYGIDEIFLTICLQSQLITHILESKEIAERISRCEIYVVHLENSIMLHKYCLDDLFNNQQRSVIYDKKTFIKIISLCYLNNELQISDFNGTKIISNINKNSFDEYNILKKDNYEYDKFVKFITYSDEERNFFNNYLEHMMRQNYTIEINNLKHYLRYINIMTWNNFKLNSKDNNNYSYYDFIKYIHSSQIENFNIKATPIPIDLKNPIKIRLPSVTLPSASATLPPPPPEKQNESPINTETYFDKYLQYIKTTYKIEINNDTLNKYLEYNINEISFNNYKNSSNNYNYNYKYYKFVNYIDEGNYNITFTELEKKFFSDYIKYIEETKKTIINIDYLKEYLIYINETGTRLYNNINFSDNISPFFIKSAVVFPAYKYKKRSINLSKEDQLNSTKYYLKNNEFNNNLKYFYEKYKKYKIKYLLLKNN